MAGRLVIDEAVVAVGGDDGDRQTASCHTSSSGFC